MTIDKKGSVVVAVIAVVALALSLWANLGGKVTQNYGAAGGLLIENYIPAILYNDGYKSEKEIVLSGANGDITAGDDLTVTDDATISGGSLTLTTANTATSTLVAGCIQTYATSTATPVRLSATTTVTGGINALFVFGSCPF